jgi:aminoglycoside phosphotransferase (APT) family kinase protein
VSTPIVEVDYGWDFKVLILEDRWVLRVPRHRLAVEELEKEILLLPAIADRLPVQIPRFAHVSREPLYVTYPLIRGDRYADEDPLGVRAFLDALHAVPVDEVPAPHPDWLETYREQADEFQRVVLPVLDPDERPRGEALLGEVETLTDFRPALTHSDIAPTHLLVQDGKLAGVIDWGDARIGDPAIDYAWLLNEPFPDWGVEDELRRRARIYYRLAPWFDVHYGDFTDQPQWVRSGLAGIRSRL